MLNSIVDVLKQKAFSKDVVKKNLCICQNDQTFWQDTERGLSKRGLLSQRFRADMDVVNTYLIGMIQRQPEGSTNNGISNFTFHLGNIAAMMYKLGMINDIGVLVHLILQCVSVGVTEGRIGRNRTNEKISGLLIPNRYISNKGLLVDVSLDTLFGGGATYDNFNKSIGLMKADTSVGGGQIHNLYIPSDAEYAFALLNLFFCQSIRLRFPISEITGYINTKGIQHEDINRVMCNLFPEYTPGIIKLDGSEFLSKFDISIYDEVHIPVAVNDSVRSCLGRNESDLGMYRNIN